MSAMEEIQDAIDRSVAQSGATITLAWSSAYERILRDARSEVDGGRASDPIYFYQANPVRRPWAICLMREAEDCPICEAIKGMETEP